jgi:hypothetical protein
MLTNELQIMTKERLMSEPLACEDNNNRSGVVLAACMRNEGLFLVEWLAHHALLGFKDIIVFTNNWTDGSDLLLDRLQELGYVTHIDNRPASGQSPQHAAMDIAIAHPLVAQAEWLMHIDADEFININTDKGTIQSVLDGVGEADVVAFLWRLFGNSGMTEWHGGSVLPSFTQSQAHPLRRTVHHKSAWRPEKFGRAIDHMPKDPLVDDFIVKNTAGQKIKDTIIRHPIKCRYKADFRHLTFENAYINHYALKSDDILLMKNDRGDGHGNVHSNYYLNSNYYRKNNRNEAEDRSILTRWDEIKALMDEMRADPEVRALEDACNAAFFTRRAEILTPEQIQAWTVPATDTEV